MSSKANIRTTLFNQRSPQPLEVGVLQWSPEKNRWTSKLHDVIGLRADSVKNNLDPCFKAKSTKCCAMPRKRIFLDKYTLNGFGRFPGL